MKFWITHFSSAFIYMLILLPFYLIIRYIIIRKKEIDLKKEILLLIFTLYLIALYSQTIFISIPSNFKIGINGNINTDIFKVFYDSLRLIKEGKYSYFIINLLGNIIFFIPIGFLLPYIFNKIRIHKIMIIGFIISFSIEILQLLLVRATDIDDILLNTLGVFLGYLLYKFFNK